MMVGSLGEGWLGRYNGSVGMNNQIIRAAISNVINKYRESQLCLRKILVGFGRLKY